MQQAYIHPPKTLLEVYRMLPEGTCAEIIDNQLFMSPAPKSKHQEVVFKLSGQLYLLLGEKSLGKAYPSPIDVYLDKKNVFQPDIVFVSTKNLDIIKEDGLHGAPDLVIEVISKGTEKFDFTKKKKVYEKSGVKEYWLIDHDTKNCYGFRLVDGKFLELPASKEKFSSPLLKHTFKF